MSPLTTINLGLRAAVSAQTRRIEYAAAWLTVYETTLGRAVNATDEAAAERYEARAHRAWLMAHAWSRLAEGKRHLGDGNRAGANDCARMARHAYRLARSLKRQWGFR